ncbi:MAG TPA: hypothetical protein VNU97_19810 [Rhizomicrobium sp.]|jgi:hypothetical protein|nr:hypothetical protein [Rhizomicrobium sp.]
MAEIPRASELTAGEMRVLRDIIARSFVSAGTVPRLRRERLLAMGLVSAGMGGLMPTPTGRIVAQTLP